MKLFKFIIGALAASMLIQGCTREYYGSNVYTRFYPVTPSDWQKNEGPTVPGAYNYFYAQFENPDITDAVIERGTVQAYIYAIYDFSKNLGSWNPLPYVYPYEAIIEEGGTTSTVVIPENTRFEFEPGIVTFIIQDLDGHDPEELTNTMTIKVSVTI